ncbi:MAG: hypothetical protein KC910_30370, partial [Candidatus Eremiobacteraeota bacterium]|nr:hypothetical protein [Candidatus Eremiobacteraeota bacterium]
MAALHEEMKAVLSEAQEPLEPAAIAERIAASGRLVRKDGKPVPVAQIVARAGKYPELFENIEGKLGLKAPDPLVVGQEYTREQAHHRLERGTAFSPATWGKEDIVPIKSTEDCALFVTDEAPGSLAEGILGWHSKPQQKLSHPTIAGFLGHDPEQSTVHLFFRTEADHDYTYLGPVAYLDHEPDQE